MQSVGGSRRSQPFRRLNEAPLEHRPLVITSLTEAERLGTTVGGQFGWGGTPLKRNRGGPKVGSGGTEIHRRGQGQKPA